MPKHNLTIVRTTKSLEIQNNKGETLCSMSIIDLKATKHQEVEDTLRSALDERSWRDAVGITEACYPRINVTDIRQ